MTCHFRDFRPVQFGLPTEFSRPTVGIDNLHDFDTLLDPALGLVPDAGSL